MENQREKHGGSRVAKKAKKPRKQSRLTGGQKFLVVLAVLLAIALAVVIGLRAMFVQPDVGNKGPGKGGQEDRIDWGDGTRPKAEGVRKSQDFYTILILGRDTGGGGNTDTMLLASYDVTNQKAAVMSIPRDTMVNVPWDVKKINSVYNMKGGGDKGLQALYKEISQLVGFEPDYQVIVEWEAVGALVDAIGGVYFDNPYPMDYHDPNQDLVIEQAPGYRLLDGEDAMQVIRWRKNDKDSPYGYHGGIGDSGRMELQQDFLKAVLQQLLKPANVMNIGKIAKVFQDNVETDLSFQNILWFGKQAVSGGLSPDTVEFLTMPYRGTSCYSRSYTKQLGRYFELSYVVPRPNELLDMVNNHLSPYVDPFVLSDLDIMSVNKDGTISSTTGHVEDSAATKVPVRPAVKPETDPNAPIDPNELPEGVDPEELLPVDPNAPVDPEAPAVPADPNAPVDPEEPGPDEPLPETPETENPAEPPAKETTPEPQPEPVPEPEPEPQTPADPIPPAADSGFVTIDPEAAA